MPTDHAAPERPDAAAGVTYGGAEGRRGAGLPAAETKRTNGRKGRQPNGPAANLQESQELFRLAVESCPSGMVMIDRAGKIILVNSAIERMFRYPRGDLIGQSVDILVPEMLLPQPHDDDRADHSRMHPANERRDLFGRRKDASEFPVEVVLNPIHAGEDLLVLSVIVDVSERRAAEQHLGQMEGKYRGLLEAAPDAMVVVNQRGEIVLLNVQAEKQFGYRRDELVGQKVNNIIPEGFAERLIADALRSEEDALAQQIGTGIELSGRRKNGSDFPIEIMLSPLDSAEGVLVTAAIRDISVRKGMERLKDEFVSTVSHELRTPLTSIAGALGLLIAGPAGTTLPESATRLLAIAHANSQRLVRLVNDILDIEKIEAGKVVFDFQRLNVRSLVEQAIEANDGFAESYDVHVRLAETPSVCTVWADPDRLVQVVTNLLSNAIKFSPKGGEVTVAIEPRDESVRISVRDNGPGIPAEFRSHIFQKFAQADATDARPKSGTGLGLSIARQIAIRLGGHVGFDDAPGGGAIFHLDLPSWESVASRYDAPRRPLVLHVDDDPDALRAVVQALGASTELISVDSVGAARQAIREKQFDLAVLDIALGSDSGLDLLPDLHDIDDKAIPVVILSIHSERVACDAQVQAVLRKSPASIDGLFATVHDQLALRPSSVFKEVS